jgi:hypothetical protein
MSPEELVLAAFERFDAVNRGDPRHEVDPATGEEIAVELLYASRMSARLAAFAPDASAPLRLAVRAQHIARWRIARAAYPEGRAGYKRWRSELARSHADLAGSILAELGADPTTVGRVRDLLVKKGLGHDRDAQTLEDVACLVFLEHHLADFARKQERARLIEILTKTWRKMSERGREAALALPLSDELVALVAEAVGAPGSPRPRDGSLG